LKKLLSKSTTENISKNPTRMVLKVKVARIKSQKPVHNNHRMKRAVLENPKVVYLN